MLNCLVTLVVLALVVLLAMWLLPRPKLPPELLGGIETVDGYVAAIPDAVQRAVFAILWWCVKAIFNVLVQHSRNISMSVLGGFWAMICVNPPWLTLILEALPFLKRLFGGFLAPPP
jgi:hypothetical protein